METHDVQLYENQAAKCDLSHRSDVKTRRGNTYGAGSPRRARPMAARNRAKPRRPPARKRPSAAPPQPELKRKDRNERNNPSSAERALPTRKSRQPWSPAGIAPEDCRSVAVRFGRVVEDAWQGRARQPREGQSRQICLHSLSPPPPRRTPHLP